MSLAKRVLHLETLIYGSCISSESSCSACLGYDYTCSHQQCLCYCSLVWCKAPQEPSQICEAMLLNGTSLSDVYAAHLDSWIPAGSTCELAFLRCTTPVKVGRCVFASHSLSCRPCWKWHIASQR